jgi:hypothetical protein
MAPLLSVFNPQAQAAKCLSLRSGSQLEEKRGQTYQVMSVNSVVDFDSERPKHARASLCSETC